VFVEADQYVKTAVVIPISFSYGIKIYGRMLDKIVYVGDNLDILKLLQSVLSLFV
jgi:hypothetical protein